MGEMRDATSEANDRQITWVLANDGMPVWVKDALRAALEHDPIDAASYAEILRCVLAGRVARWASLLI